MEVALLIIIAVGVLGTLAVLFLRPSGDKQVDVRLEALAFALESLRTQVDQRLSESRVALEKGQHRSLDVLGRVSGQLGEQREALRRVDEFQKDLKKFQELLQPPKARGGVGEVLLERLLTDMMPKGDGPGTVTRNLSFQDGTHVEFAIRLSDYMVPVDAKFPKEGFENLQRAETESERLKAQRDFRASVKGFIDSVAKYIRPDEGTGNFAFLYFPFESVYIAYLNEPDLQAYAMHKKVYVVSPGSFYAYLNTILDGLRGFAIESSAREILAAMDKLEQQLVRLDEQLSVLGKHMKNAAGAYDDSKDRLRITRDVFTKLTKR